MAGLPSVGGSSTQPVGSIGISQSASQQTSQSLGQQQSTSFIPEYSESPILRSIAQYAQAMAPQVYQWGMDQFNRNQGNIDALMRQGQLYSSPQRIASEMGMAEAGVAQAGEKAREGAMRDLESYGIDPSSGRYAALDQANRVQTAASAAGAGNQQRMATEAAGTALQNQALSAGMQNVAMGYGASNAMNALLGTGMQLKYPPLGQESQSYNSSYGQGTSQSQSLNESGPGVNPTSIGYGYGSITQPNQGAVSYSGGTPQFGSVTSSRGFARGGSVEPTQGGFVSRELSPSGGDHTDDVNARLNAGEYVIPKDIVQWKGKEFFAKLIAQARKQRATGNGEHQQQQQTGYAGGGEINFASNKPARLMQPARARDYTGAPVDMDAFNLAANGIRTGRFAQYERGGEVSPENEDPHDQDDPGYQIGGFVMPSLFQPRGVDLRFPSRGTVVTPPPQENFPAPAGFGFGGGEPSVSQPPMKSVNEMRPAEWKDLPHEPRGYAAGGPVTDPLRTGQIIDGAWHPFLPGMNRMSQRSI